MELFIISGTSGAGKSIALHALEDLNFYCIDNLPVALLTAFVDEIISANRDESTPNYKRAAVGIDARNLNEDFTPYNALIEELNEKVNIRTIFIDANDEILIKRFSETRRRHPLAGDNLSLDEAISHERLLLSPIASSADLKLDSTRTNVHELRDIIQKDAGRESGVGMSILFQSFGFKHGLPIEADFVFDVRCMPNPHWEPRLRAMTGQDKDVQHFLENHFEVNRMFGDITKFLESWLDSFKENKRSYLTVAIGCTGGQHRSVYFVERLAEYFSDSKYATLVRHRELT
ncbi:MAG: RNase adapter RapZ [Gammaproteobacteria bacterium]|nr:RNase adapter RapZ [Gammaproteobacteria bacterium]